MTLISKRDFVRMFGEACLASHLGTEPQGDALRGGFMAGALAKPGTEPKWNTIFPRGTWHGPNFARMGGSFTVDDAFMSEVVENWNASGKPRIPVRWGHEHMKAGATPELKRALDRKAGNVVDLRITGAGLEGLTDWNPEGAADVSNGTFDGWSAEWWPKHVNRLTGETRGWYLSGVALTNEPYFELLPRIAASAGEAERGVDAARKWLKAAIVLHEKHMSGRAPTTGPEGEKSQQQMMDQMMSALAALDSMPPVAASTTSTDPTPQHRSNTMTEEQLKLRASLGLASTATDAEVLTAQTKQSAELAALKASAEKNGPSAILAVVEPVQKQVEALTAALAKREAEATALNAAMLDRDVDALIARMKSGDGKNGRAIVVTTLKPVVLALVASAKTPTEGLKVAEDFITANIGLTVPITSVSQEGTGAEPLTAAAASAKLAVEVEKLTKEGNITPWLSAMARHPELALTAQEGK